jgi:hypothetical protein
MVLDVGFSPRLCSGFIEGVAKFCWERKEKVWVDGYRYLE